MEFQEIQINYLEDSLMLFGHGNSARQLKIFFGISKVNPKNA